MGEAATSRALIWKVQPKHGLEEWQIGRVNIQNSKDFRVVISVQRNNKAIGYVAIDDFEFSYDSEPCSIEPAEATPPTTTTTTTTTTTPIESMNCNFQDKNLCGWDIDNNLNATGRFHFERKNGDENLLIAALPDQDHAGSRTGTQSLIVAITNFYNSLLQIIFFGLMLHTEKQMKLLP